MFWTLGKKWNWDYRKLTKSFLTSELKFRTGTLKSELKDCFFIKKWVQTDQFNEATNDLMTIKFREMNAKQLILILEEWASGIKKIL